MSDQCPLPSGLQKLAALFPGFSPRILRAFGKARTKLQLYLRAKQKQTNAYPEDHRELKESDRLFSHHLKRLLDSSWLLKSFPRSKRFCLFVCLFAVRKQSERIADAFSSKWRQISPSHKDCWNGKKTLVASFWKVSERCFWGPRAYFPKMSSCTPNPRGTRHKLQLSASRVGYWHVSPRETPLLAPKTPRASEIPDGFTTSVFWKKKQFLT